MTPGGERGSRRAVFLDWRALLGFLISGGLLWYAFREVHLGEVWSQVQRADLPLLALATLVVSLAFPIRALRWKPLIAPTLPESRFRPRFAATCIGFMANNLLPVRVGEFARAYSLSRLEPIRASTSFGSLVVERTFDGFVVVTLLLVAMAWPTFPEVSGRDFGSIALWTGALFLVLFVVLLLVVAQPDRSVRLLERTVIRVLPRSFRRRVVDALAAFLEGLTAIRDWRLVLRVITWSYLLWLVTDLGMWIGMIAFGIDLPFIAAVFLQSVIALAVALPSAPGFFGVFEAAVRIALVHVWAVASSPALAFGIGFHLAGFIPVTIVGLYYLWRLGLSFGEVEASEDAVETEIEEATGGNGPEIGQ